MTSLRLLAALPLALAAATAQPKVDIHVYMGAQHGFGCNERGSYSKPDYDLAQSRTLEFFTKNLG
mgnify:CR=1 FL=1